MTSFLDRAANMVDVEGPQDICFNFIAQNKRLTCGLVVGFVGFYRIWKWYRRSVREVIVFTRYPEPGKTKTRMIPTLGETGAALLQTRMTEHIITHLQGLQKLMGEKFTVTLQYNGGTKSQMEYWLNRRLCSLLCSYRPQADGSLGEKLKHAIRSSFQRGNKHVIVIGADIPGINSAVFIDAFTALTKDKQTDMVIGPAIDGGYYLIGFNSKADKYLDDIFLDIEWGTDKVFSQQMEKVKSLGMKAEVLSQKLSDVDIADDLKVFEQEVGVARQQLNTSNWSIIMPVLNEKAVIKETLEDILKEKCSNVQNLVDIIVSDGGSTDNTVDIVKEFAKSSPVKVKVVNSKPGRGNQQITGAAEAKGDNFLFLHADTKLPKDFDLAASRCLQTPGNVAGAFEFYLNILDDEKIKESENWWFVKKMTFVLRFANMRTKKYEYSYGDQAPFMSRLVYERVGGFAPVFLMEDFIMIEKLMKIGHIAVTEDYKAVTDYRRWKKWGVFRITLFNQFLILAYKCGVHPNTLAGWYYGKKIKTE